MENLNFDQSAIQSQLLERRKRLENAISDIPENHRLVGLLQEVDAALERMEKGVFGICEACHEPIEPERLITDPLTRLCIDHLTTDQQRALEQDLDLASQIQKALLPKNKMILGNWEVSYYYQPAGPVSGDYCDLVEINKQNGDILFVLGDVSGKGVAASMLMSHLHAVIHSLAAFDLSVSQLVDRANRIFCESTLATHYATLVCGKIRQSGEIEICNAGHLPVLHIRGNEVVEMKSTGIPIGLFCNSEYTIQKAKLNPSDKLVLYTDGLSEAWNNKEEFGLERILELAARHSRMNSDELIQTFLSDYNTFMKKVPPSDDLTLMTIQRR